MPLHPLAGQPVPDALLIDETALLREYRQRKPDLADPTQRVSFGTSGHRGTSRDGTFTQAHIRAITQAICDYRQAQGITGPILAGKDTHALSRVAENTALEVLAANGVETLVARDDGFTPTPVISHAILAYNKGRRTGLADGIVITPSHNPPSDGGFKYNPPQGGPADTDVTSWIEQRANAILKDGSRDVRFVSIENARKAATTHEYDFIGPYVTDLAEAVDLEAVQAAGVRIGVDPLGGASLPFWQPIRERYRLDLTVVNTTVDPTFRFMTVDHDGKVRMDCSSPYAMAKLVDLKSAYDVAFGTDPDADRHGIVAPSAGLLNPNHYLAVAIRYLFTHRPQWPATAAVGKTLVSSGIIDRVAASIGRPLCEVPVGFKWFAPGLFDGSLGFGGEESAGASFLRRDGSVWTTDKDGLLLGLLAAEITAITGRDPGEHFEEIAAQFGRPHYSRIDRPATPQQKARLKKLTPSDVAGSTLAGDPIEAKLTEAPGNRAAIGGLKVVTRNGWFAARPSGTENIYKIYAESFVDADHLTRILDEAGDLVTRTVGA